VRSLVLRAVAASNARSPGNAPRHPT
jgi:hypothetical protein